MHLEDVCNAIKARLPELVAALSEYDARWAPETPGAYNISADVLFPALERWLGERDNDDGLQRAFALLEELSQESDAEVRYWVNDVVSWLLQRDEWIVTARPYLGRSLSGLICAHQEEARWFDEHADQVAASLRRRRRWWPF